MSNSEITLSELLFKALEDFPSGLFSSTKRNGKWYPVKLGEFKKRVKHTALGLHKLGIKAGDKVSLHAENSTEWLICDLAMQSIGVVSVPIYTTQHGDQIKYILENSDAKIHFVSNDDLFAETKPFIDEVENIQAVVTFFSSKHDHLKELTEIEKLGEELDKQNPELYSELRSRVKSDDLVTLIYTSGTTGMPKGVMLTQNNIASNVIASLEILPLPDEEFYSKNVLSYLPLSHVFERMVDYMYICRGCKIHYIEAVEDIRDDFQEVKPFFMATVPRLLEKIHTGVKVKGQELSGIRKNLYYWAIYLTESYDPENPPEGLDALKHKIADRTVYSKIRELFGGRFRGLVSGGAALTPEIFKFMNAIGFMSVQGYGLTETSPVIAAHSPGNMRVGSTGKPLRGVEIKIADDGEIITRGPNVMAGYYNDEEKTREVFTEDGWLKTGDIGKIDDDGFLYITDRKKSMFKLSTGKYVAPQNIENQISSSGFIEQVVVIGYQRKFCSALIVPAYENVVKRLKRDDYEPGKPYSSDEKVRSLIQQEVDKANKILSPWETVKRFELLEEPLTIESGDLTPTLKVKRPIVLQKFKAKIESMYQED